MEGAVIVFEEVCKAYDQKEILKNFCLEVDRGEFLTIIGSSGCGKTTMLKMVNGLNRPDRGTIRLWGQDISQLDIIPLRRKIGYVIQGTGLFPHLKVGENIAYVPRLMGQKKTEELVGRLMKLVGLDEDLRGSYPAELSGGQQQRVGLARALAASPEIVLMDEPFSAVDEITREHLQEEIGRIHGELGLTILFITHDIRESMKLGSRMLVMDEGRIVQTGPPERVRENPVNDFVRQLLGSEAGGKSVC